MIKPREEPSPTVSELSSLDMEHADLAARAARIESLLAGLRGRADGPQIAEVRRLLDEFQRRLMDHLAAEEQGGYLERAAVVAPRFHRKTEMLLEQHTVLREWIGALVREPEEGGWAASYVAFCEFRQVLREHERAETDVLQRAYLEDLGGHG